MNKKHLYILIILLFPVFCKAEETTHFTPDKWSEGLHLFGGGGLEVNRYFSPLGSRHIHPGLGLYTSLDWMLNDSLALQISSDAGFTPAHSSFLWSTAFNLGVRTRFPGIAYSAEKAPYMRFFVGWGPAVAFPPADEGAAGAQLGDVRLQLHGPLAGIAAGYLFQNKSGKIWFIDVSLYVHAFFHLDVVESSQTMPVVISQQDMGNHPLFVSMHFIVGLLAF